MPLNHRRRWTVADDDKLQFWWGYFSLRTIAMRLDRTPWAIAQRARMLKLGPFSKGLGVSSMRAFERFSGFSILKIRAAAQALSITINRMQVSDPAHGRPKRQFAITEDQQAALLKHMLEHPLYYKNLPGAGKTTKGVWGIGRKPSACVRCGRNDRPHFAKGKCNSCYSAKYKKPKAVSKT